ncbi:arylformamidase [Gracilibacillus ureilyticus]|uniref:Kynurenine formamidase n=1 Tax=Gracilibacillus ureilyticus TaxID=531814 RepID=A0A1H9QAA8_9BACI|nr:cyclase family protein [Gracilibacillus ureilyticus]SER57384.1 arylformamidase [Gracilibacillus ureilyticus]
MKFYDISMNIHPDMQVWEDMDSKKPRFDTKSFGHITDTTMKLNAHTGTHIDAPLHMINNAAAFETISLERLVRNVKVIDLEHVKDGITKSDLEAHSIKKGDFVLLKTKNSVYESNSFDFQFVYLKEDGADYLAEKEIDGVGIDTLGVERSQENFPTHIKLLGANIIILEGIRLAEIDPGEYFMVAAPLKLTGTEASPARVLLFEKNL